MEAFVFYSGVQSLLHYRPTPKNPEAVIAAKGASTKYKVNTLNTFVSVPFQFFLFNQFLKIPHLFFFFVMGYGVCIDVKKAFWHWLQDNKL